MRSLTSCRKPLAALLLLNILLAADAFAQSCPTGTFNGSLGAGDATQTGRVNRLDPPSDCGGPKPYPGTADATPGRRYDQYTFTNTAASPVCVQVTLDPQSCAGANEIFSAAYLGSFNPADVSQNYLGDSGDSPAANTPVSYSFNVPAGATFVVVVHEINPGAGCAAYTLSLGCGTPGAGVGQVLISEFRLSGPGAASGDGVDQRDEFVELYNNTDAPVSIGRYLLRAFDPAFGDFTFEIPPGSTIPARGHFLVGDSVGYSLPGYAALDLDTLPFFDGDVFIDNEGIQLIGPPLNQVIVDSVGFAGGGNEAQYVEGTGLTRRSSTPDMQYSYVRKFNVTRPQDTNNNAADFALISVTGETFAEAGPTMLGAPGPENRASPIERDALFGSGLLDPTKSSTAEPNRVRNQNPVPNGQFGTLSLQRRVVNNSGVPLTRVRFRVCIITTLNSPGYVPGGPQADVRVLSSSGVVTRTDGSTVVTVTGLTLEEPPGQPNGGGYNSTLAAGTITPADPLMPGEALDMQVLAGVMQTGNYRLWMYIEALP